MGCSERGRGMGIDKIFFSFVFQFLNLLCHIHVHLLGGFFLSLFSFFHFVFLSTLSYIHLISSDSWLLLFSAIETKMI